MLLAQLSRLYFLQTAMTQTKTVLDRFVKASRSARQLESQVLNTVCIRPRAVIVGTVCMMDIIVTRLT